MYKFPLARVPQAPQARRNPARWKEIIPPEHPQPGAHAPRLPAVAANFALRMKNLLLFAPPSQPRSAWRPTRLARAACAAVPARTAACGARAEAKILRPAAREFLRRTRIHRWSACNTKA